MKLIEVYERNSNHKKVVESYGLLVDLEPKKETHYLMHARSLTKIRKFEDALEVLDTGLML
jgi:hypothetical protein